MSVMWHIYLLQALGIGTPPLWTIWHWLYLFIVTFFACLLS